MRGHHADLVPGGVHLALNGHIIGFHPDQEPRQAGHIRRLIGQRLRQKLVNAIFRLIPQPRQKPFAPVVPGQRAFDQIKGPQEIRLIAQVPQHVHGLGMPRAVAQGFPQEPLTAVGQPKQLILAPPTKGRAQNGGQRQIILRRGQKRQKRRQILNRKLGPQPQPVSPGNRQALGLAGPDDLGKHGRPALHQDQHIPRMHQARIALFIGNLRARRNHPADFSRDLVGKLGAVVSLVHKVHRVIPVLVLFGLGRLNQRPKIHPARQAVIHPDMVRTGTQRLIEPCLKGLVHQPQDRRRRPERIAQLHRLELLFRGFELGLERRMFRIKGGDIGTLERIDRLFLVAHHKQGARAVRIAPLARGELFGQKLDHLPLVG